MSKLDGIKVGDRVRVTFEGIFNEESSEAIYVTTDGGLITTQILTEETNTPTFQITRIEPPFKVGDRVVYMGLSFGTVIAFTSDGRAVLEYQSGDNTNVIARDISCLTHA